MRNQYLEQKYNAIRRGIPFHLTYEEWLDIWGDKLSNRGKGINKYQMCRKADQGAYEIGNVYIDTHEANSKAGRRVKMNGKIYQSIYEAAKENNIHYNTWYYRYKQGWEGYEYVILEQ